MIMVAPRRSYTPLNYSPWWQVALVLLPILLGFLYALPNLYGEDPVIQISAHSSKSLDLISLQDEVSQLLKTQQLHPRAVVALKDRLLIYWPDLSSQRHANERLNQALNGRYVVALNLLPATPHWLKVLGAGPMKLGLDLRGGVHFLLEIDSDVALSKHQRQLSEELRAMLLKQRIRYRQVKRSESGAIILGFPEGQGQQQAQKVLAAAYPELTFTPISETALRATLSDRQRQHFGEQALQQSLTALRKRINELGVAEAVVQRQGERRLVVELPGIQDSTRAKELLGATATLAFHLVNQQVDFTLHPLPPLPPDTEVCYRRNGSKVALFKQVILNGEHITHASASLDPYGRPQVNIVLDSLGGRQMEAATKTAIGKAMATLLIEYRQQQAGAPATRSHFKKYREVINVAQIEDRLSHQFRISGIGTLAEARHLALLLRSGALSAPLQIIEERTIGPSLGQQNIVQGLRACCWGLGATLLFMVAYYRKLGAIAILALLANLLLLIGSLSLLPGITLTLPGIAGIVLTMGMAVDANVLIFERIKEELGLGRTVQQAIQQGYRNAFSSIADANLTTLITALILYTIGTGPVKGFAITLAIGLATSMFTSVVGTRTLINVLYGGKRLQTLSI